MTVPVGFRPARWSLLVGNAKEMLGGEASAGLIGFWMPLHIWLSVIPFVSMLMRDRAVLRLENRVVMLGDRGQVIAVGTMADIHRKDGWKCSLLIFNGKRMWVTGKPLRGLDNFVT